MSDRAVRTGDAFDVAAVAAWLAAQADPGRAGVDLSAVPEVRQFSGGVSNRVAFRPRCR